MINLCLRLSGLTYRACGQFTKTKERIQKFKETRDSEDLSKRTREKYIYQNELDKAYFQHDMAHGNFKDLTRKTASDKILRDKPFNTVENSKYGISKDLLQ